MEIFSNLFGFLINFSFGGDMEDIIEVIKSRRSIRRYKEEKIPRATVIEILEAGQVGPFFYEQSAVAFCSNR